MEKKGTIYTEPDTDNPTYALGIEGPGIYETAKYADVFLVHVVSCNPMLKTLKSATALAVWFLMKWRAGLWNKGMRVKLQNNV